MPSRQEETPGKRSYLSWGFVISTRKIAKLLQNIVFFVQNYRLKAVARVTEVPKVALKEERSVLKVRKRRLEGQDWVPFKNTAGHNAADCHESRGRTPDVRRPKA